MNTTTKPQTPPMPANVRTAYAKQGIDVDAVVAQAISDQQSGVTINKGRAWAADNHPGKAAVLYTEAWLASMKINGPAR